MFRRSVLRIRCIFVRFRLRPLAGSAKPSLDTTRTRVFREYLRENETFRRFRETVFACSYRAQVEFFVLKNCRKSRNTVPLIYLPSLISGYTIIRSKLSGNET